MKQAPRRPPESRVLLVQIDSLKQTDLHRTLERNGFQVVAESTIKDALHCIAIQDFVALICDLHLPAAGDGFTLVNAMRHSHPDAVTIIISDFPALRESLAELLPQADEILVTPIPLDEIVTRLKRRLLDPYHRTLKARESVATILERYSSSIITEWLKRVKRIDKSDQVRLSDADRTGHLQKLVQELVRRLRTPHVDEGSAKLSIAAVAHGKARQQQGYTPAMLVQESRILQVCIFKTLRNNLNAVDLALVLTDVMTIADEVDSQLTQTIASFSEISGGAREMAG